MVGVAVLIAYAQLPLGDLKATRLSLQIQQAFERMDGGDRAEVGEAQAPVFREEQAGV